MRRPWTKKEEAYLKANARKSARVIAERLGRTTGSVQQHRAKLGIRIWEYQRITPDKLELIRQWNQEGVSDTEIGRRLGSDRHAISLHRRRLGLPSQGHGPQAIAATSEASKKQLARAGLKCMSELRLEAWRKHAVERGWPETVCGKRINPRHVQILEVLYARGPQTRNQIAIAVGIKVHANQRKTMSSRDKGGSYLAGLMNAGLVMKLGKVPTGKPGKGNLVYLYALALDVERDRP